MAQFPAASFITWKDESCGGCSELVHSCVYADCVRVCVAVAVVLLYLAFVLLQSLP